MAARGHVPSVFDGRSIQAPGMMRHGPVPTLGSTSLHPVESVPPPEILENKVAVQGAEMDRLLRENQRLAATHGALRQELLIAQQEMQKVRGHIARVQAESDAQIRGLLDKISKMEAEIKAGESIKKELQQAHVEAQGLFGARQEMTMQIQQVTDELQRTHSELKKLPEMHSELEEFMQEHQKLRSTFEHEKGSNMELVQKMHAMENNLVSMAREVEKLRLEVQNAEKRVQGQTNSYADSSYGQGSVYGNSGYSQVGGYTGGNFFHGMAGSYSDPYGRTQVQTSNAAVVEGTNPYAGGVATVTTASYDASGAAGSMPGNYDAARAGTGGSAAYDAARGSMAAVGPHDAARGVAVSGYDATKGVVVSSAVQYDSSRVGTASGYDATRGAVVSNAVQYDAARAGMTASGYEAARGAAMGSTVQYDPSRVGMSGSGAYDVPRGQPPMPR